MEVANATLFTYLFFLLPLTFADSDSFFCQFSLRYFPLNFEREVTDKINFDVIINDFASVKARHVHL